MDIIQLEFELNLGKAGLDDDPYNPLSRALRIPLESGKPQDGLVLCFYHSEEIGRIGDSPIRWLGAIVHSGGGRIIFFPGLAEAPDWIQTTTGGATQTKDTFNWDHVTLEPTRQSWHFTTQASSQHRGGGRCPQLGQGRLNWFGLSLQFEDTLRIASSSTMAFFSSPPNDTNRRLNHAIDLQSRAPYHSVGLISGSKKRYTEGFLHLSFIALPKGASTYEGPNWLVPVGSPSLLTPLPSTIAQLAMRVHKVIIPGGFDLQITCMWLPGKLGIPAVLTTHNSL